MKYVLSLIFLFAFFACRKSTNEAQNDYVPGSARFGFFNRYETNHEDVQKIISSLEYKESKFPFVDQTVRQVGYPRWDKTVRLEKTANSRLSEESGDTVVHYIPLVRENERFVNAALVVKSTAEDTLYYFLCDWEYALFQQESELPAKNAERFASFFMRLDKLTFGTSRFTLTDPTLFRVNGRETAEIVIPDSSGRRTNRVALAQTCENWIVNVTNCPYQDDPNICKPNCDRCPLCPTEQALWESCMDAADFFGAGIFSVVPRGTGGGGFGPAPVNPKPPLCPGVINYGTNPNFNCGPAWHPTIPTLSYKCDYELTQEDRDIIDQINQEDANSDNFFNQGLDCKGTNSFGPLHFQGVREHLMIQFDFLASKPHDR